MKKFKRRAIGILLTALLLLGSVSLVSAEEAEPQYYLYEDFIYEVLDNNTATIHSYVGKRQIVYVPAYLEGLPVKRIEPLAFYGLDTWEIILPEGIEYIGDEAFFNSTVGLINIPSTVKTFGKAVFRNCTRLYTVTFDGDFTDLGEYMFYGCTGLKNINLPKYTLVIPTGSFSYCTNVSDLDLPSGLEYIEPFAFYDSGIEEVHIPASVMGIEEKAFGYCTELNSITKESKYIDYIASDAFVGCPTSLDPGDVTPTDPSMPDDTTPTDPSDPSEETNTIYFTNNKNWESVYLYAFNGEIGKMANSEPMGVYPGTKMTFVRTNEQGQDIYSIEVPADVDYIKFCDGDLSGENNRTNNIPNSEFGDNTGFYLEEKASAKYWPYKTYTYDPDSPVEPPIPDNTTKTIYFVNNNYWEDVYIQGYTDHGWGYTFSLHSKKMTFVKTNEQGLEVYYAEVPVDDDIDLIQFSNDKGANDICSDYIPYTGVDGNTCFYLKEKGEKYWSYNTFTYDPANPSTPSDLKPIYPNTSSPEDRTKTIYFVNNNYWEKIYLQGFTDYSWGNVLASQSIMTYVCTNEQGLDVYRAEIPIDVDIFRFSEDGTRNNDCTDYIQNAEIDTNTCFYLIEKGEKYWSYTKFIYDPTEPKPTNPDPTEPSTPEPSTPEDTKVTIYFTNNMLWNDVYLYAWFGEPDMPAEREPMGEYPGTQMTYVKTNSYGQDIYSIEVPADVDYIKFNDGNISGENNRTDKIPNSEFIHNTNFYLEEKADNEKHWGYRTHLYVPDDTHPTEDELETTPTDPYNPPPYVPGSDVPLVSGANFYIVDDPNSEDLQKSEKEYTEQVETIIIPHQHMLAAGSAHLPMRGDTDLSGKVNVQDATTFQKHLAKIITLSDLALKCADVDTNGKYNVRDATSIQKYAAGLLDENWQLKPSKQ